MQITTEPKPLTPSEQAEYVSNFDELVAEEKAKLSEARQFLLKREVTKAWHICLRAGVLEAQMRHLSNNLKSWNKNTEKALFAFFGLSLLMGGYEWLTGNQIENRLWSLQLIALFLIGYAGFLLTSYLPTKTDYSVKESEFHLLKTQFEGLGAGQDTFYYFLEKNIVYGGLFDYRKMDVITRIRRDIFETML